MSMGWWRLRVAVTAFMLAAVSLGAVSVQQFDAQRQSLPPHAEPPVAEVLAPLPVTVTAGYPGEIVEEQARVEWFEGVAKAEWFEGVRRAEEAVRVAAARQAASRRLAGSGGCEGEWVIPASIVRRESGCRFDAVNPTGCGGYSCVGAYQFDARHWDASSGWGGCADLGDWRDPEAQHECARRLSSGGSSLRPWGG